MGWPLLTRDFESWSDYEAWLAREGAWVNVRSLTMNAPGGGNVRVSYTSAAAVDSFDVRRPPAWR